MKTTASIVCLSLLTVIDARAQQSSPAEFGAQPELPAPEAKWLPTLHIAKAKGWDANQGPQGAPGTVVTALARGLKHPRWLYVLPNGDVLVAETDAPVRPDDGKGIAGKVGEYVMKRAGSGSKPSANQITLLRQSSGEAGRIALDDKPVEVAGQAWMDREWSSQPLAPGQSGWDWLSLHLKTGEKLMLYRIRQTDGNNYSTGNWISPDSTSEPIAPSGIKMIPGTFTEVGTRRLPTAWRIEIPAHRLAIDCTALNPQSWMTTTLPYWEGPVSFTGSHTGVGYLEMTGY